MIRQHGAFKGTVIIGGSLLAGLLLTILPLPSWAEWYRPAWVLLILMYWMVVLPHRVGIATAWIVGLLMDLLTGSVLGLHALFFTLFAFFVLKFNLALRGMSSGQKLLLVMTIEVIYLSVQYWITAHNNVSSSMWVYWLPVLTTTLCWPWVSLLLKDYQRRFRIK